ncbi:MAG: LamG domain-containing protein, partial [Planctomycetes bacterium]|nr:LamG domain-containing protein [Planctomycetota bacterium]
IGADEVPYAGDSEPDDDVDVADFAAFAPWWMQTGCDAANAFCNGADIVPDGSIGPPDLMMLTANWLNGFPLDQPFGYWRFDETAGSLAPDVAPHALHGTLTNMDDTDWVLSKAGNGNALEFDGVNDYVEITGFSGVLGGQSRTVCAWIRTNTPGGVIIAWGYAAAGNRWTMTVDSVGHLLLGVGGGAIVGSTPVSDGDWHHVAIVLENDGSPNINEVKLYVDGLPDAPSWNGSDRDINTQAEGDVTIGQYLGASFFEGTIDEVRIYDRALTAEEIAALAP